MTGYLCFLTSLVLRKHLNVPEKSYLVLDKAGPNTNTESLSTYL